ncbi:MAG: hypothetical protein KA143_12965 [Saprospiraceae bacterium]|nr:hypothetical protein [Saprospiraceae bacterium]
MKKVSKTSTLVFTLILLTAGAAYNQTNSDKKGKPELRTNASPNEGKNEHYGEGMHRDSARRHFGGKQSFRRGNGFDGRQHLGGRGSGDYRMNRFYGPQHRRHPYGPRYYGPRNFNLRGGQFQRHPFNGRLRDWDRRSMENRQQIHSELKQLKEKIWKDGVMDMKERDLLRERKKEWLNPHPDFHRNHRNPHPDQRIKPGKE